MKNWYQSLTQNEKVLFDLVVFGAAGVLTWIATKSWPWIVAVCGLVYILGSILLL